MNQAPKTYLSFLDRLRIRRRGLRRDENGQVLLLTALMAMTLIAFVAAILPTGQIVTAKIQAQNAADAAAMTAMTWMARGSNFLQGTNGFHWDVNGIMVVVIEGITYYYIAKMLEDLEVPIVGWIKMIVDWFEGMDKIGSASTARFWISESIIGSQVLAAEATPMIAFAHASAIARKNGADVFDAAYFADLRQQVPGLPAGLTASAFDEGNKAMREWMAEGEFSEGLLNWLRDRGVNLEWGIGCLLNWIIPEPHGEIPADKFKPYAWTVNPSLNPKESLELYEEAKAPAEYFPGNPLYTEVFWPFTLCLVFLKFVHWRDNYYKSKNIDVPITFMTYKAPAKSFMLNDLLLTGAQRAQGQSLAPYTYAFGSAKLTGDQLYLGGQDFTIYFSIPIFAFPIWPFPLVRLFTGGYKGSFRAEMTPVKVLNVNGAEFMVQH